jgi:hypothetical protein
LGNSKNYLVHYPSPQVPTHRSNDGSILDDLAGFNADCHFASFPSPVIFCSGLTYTGALHHREDMTELNFSEENRNRLKELGYGTAAKPTELPNIPHEIRHEQVYAQRQREQVAMHSAMTLFKNRPDEMVCTWIVEKTTAQCINHHRDQDSPRCRTESIRMCILEPHIFNYPHHVSGKS